MHENNDIHNVTSTRVHVCVSEYDLRGNLTTTTTITRLAVV